MKKKQSLHKKERKSKMNSCVFVGRIGKDSELRKTGDSNVLGFSVGSNVGYGANQSTMWIDCSVWGKRGETLQQYLKKGTQVTVSGSLSEREYTSKDGSVRKSLSLKVSDLNFVNNTPSKEIDLADEIPF